MNTLKQAGTAVLATLACAVAMAQPSGSAPAGLAAGPVRITTVFPTGSGPDTVARLVAEKLQARWQRPVVVESRPGGAGVVGIGAVKGAPATGNDLVVVDVGNMSINPLIFRKLPYDPEKDLVPVALLYTTAFFVTVSADSPYRTLQDLIGAAKAKGGTTYGSNAVGGPIHLGSAQLEGALGATMTHVPFKETSQLYTAVSTGEVQWAYGSIATTGPLVRSGKLRLLAVADAQRSPAMPQVPTLEEAGGPKGVDALTWVAMFAPRGTPPATVQDINRAVNEVLALPDVKERYAAFGFVAAPGTPQQLADTMKRDRDRYADVLKRVPVSID
jgi:tripartite-type tricarboxylate transporter receptor subunit TctC